MPFFHDLFPESRWKLGDLIPDDDVAIVSIKFFSERGLFR
jgi:hypothetical protein